MKYRITLTIDKVAKFLNVDVKHEYIDEETKDYLEEIYLTLLRSCEKGDEKAFNKAMGRFVAEDFNDALEYFEKESDNES